MLNKSQKDPVLLWTAFVWAENNQKKEMCRILVDPGSQSTHITENMAIKLRSKPIANIDLTLATAGGRISNIQNCGIHKLTLRSRFDQNKSIDIQAIELKCLSRSSFPVLNQDVGLSPLADNLSERESDLVDILLGADYLSNIEFSSPQSIGKLFAFNSIFGWITSGSPGAAPEENSLPRFCGFEIVQPGSLIREPNISVVQATTPNANDSRSCRNAQTLNDLQFLWQSEDSGLTDDLADERKEETDDLHRAMVEHYRKTTRIDDDGFYAIRLPFQENIRDLPNNEKLARSRTQSFVTKMKKDPAKLTAVDEEFQKLLSIGYIEEAKPKRKINSHTTSRCRQSSNQTKIHRQA